MSPVLRQKESRLRRRDQVRNGLDPSQRATVVYFIQSENGGEIKIGRADDVAKRLVGLQTSRPDKLVLLAAAPGTVQHERALHERFAANRSKGEWFHPVAELTALVADVSARGTVALGPCDTSRIVTGHVSSAVTPSVLCSAEPSDPTVLSLPCSAVQSARARDVADAVLPSASRGRARLREVDGGLLDFDHHGRWQTALTTIAGYPAAEWAIASTTLAQVAQDPERRGFLTPQHIVDYWATYSAGDTPGPKGADWKERAQKTAAVRKLRVDDQLRAFRAEMDTVCTALRVSDPKLAEETRLQREREYSALYKQLHGETSR